MSKMTKYSACFDGIDSLVLFTQHLSREDTVASFDTISAAGHYLPEMTGGEVIVADFVTSLSEEQLNDITWRLTDDPVPTHTLKQGEWFTQEPILRPTSPAEVYYEAGQLR